MAIAMGWRGKLIKLDTTSVCSVLLTTFIHTHKNTYLTLRSDTSKTKAIRNVETSK